MVGFQISKIKFKTLIDELQSSYGKQYTPGQIEMIWKVMEKFQEDTVIELFAIIRQRFEKFPYANDIKIMIRNTRQRENTTDDRYCSWLSGETTPDGLKTYLRRAGVNNIHEAIELIQLKRKVAIAEGKDPDEVIETFHKKIGY